MGDNNNLASQVIQTMKEHGLKLAVVESCTGGQLAASLTAVPGASAVFVGGLIPYSNAAKAQLLGINWSTLDEYGAVSEECARELVANGELALRADYTVAITGIAGPDGGTEAKPVGTVYMAWSGPHGIAVERQLFSGNRASVQQQSVERALSKLAELLTGV